MAQPAARVTDMHICPMITPGIPPIPHIGGPLLAPGVPNVLISGVAGSNIRKYGCLYRPAGHSNYGKYESFYWE